MLTNLRGFTLLELLLAVALSSVLLFAAFSGHSFLWAQAWHGQQLLRNEQSAQGLGHWLLRDLRRYLHSTAQPQVVWQASPGCLLYGEYGVRVRNQQMQWRPQDSACMDAGWLGLHDQHGFQVLALEWQPSGHPQLQGSQLCLAYRARKGLVQQWCGWL